MQLSSDGGKVFEIDGVGIVTYYILILFIFVVILVLREFFQMLKQKKRYFLKVENYIEWFLIVLTILDFIPTRYFAVRNVLILVRALPSPKRIGCTQFCAFCNQKCGTLLKKFFTLFATCNGFELAML